MASEEGELTPIQKRFVDEYLVDLNATQAYRRTMPNCKYTTARTEASKLLATPNIKAEVESALADLRERCQDDADRAVRELGLIAFTRITDVMDLSDPREPKLKPSKEVHPDAWAAVQEVSVTQYGVKVKMADKRGAVEKVLQRLGLLVPEPLEQLLVKFSPEQRATLVKALAMLAGDSGASQESTSSGK